VNRQIRARELGERLGSADAPFVLDVREPSEVATRAIPGAVNIPLCELSTRTSEIPPGVEVVVVCATGARSSHATDLLARKGWNARNLVGGMTAWARRLDAASL
jgi:rhodanese-related sulfurtransferase